VAVVDVQVSHHLTERFAPKDHAEGRCFFELLAVLKALK
jgi:hypothetical protein